MAVSSSGFRARGATLVVDRDRDRQAGRDLRVVPYALSRWARFIIARVFFCRAR
jgi:hypothetical protein